MSRNEEMTKKSRMRGTGIGVLVRLYSTNAMSYLCPGQWSIQRSIQQSIHRSIRDTYAMQQGVGYTEWHIGRYAM